MAVVAGSDPELAAEAVVVGAHLDGVGEKGGVLRPGADDDATGVASLLEMARALAASPKRPRRTVVCTFWTGEEEGHLGSGHWVRHPRWPLARIAAYVNVDMIGHPWLREEIGKLVAEAGLPDGEAFLAKARPESFIEVGVPDWVPGLDPVVARAARGTGLALHLDRIDGGRGGSDYREFALRKVPFLRFFGNFFPGYHKAGDTIEAVDAAQVERVARLVLASAWLLAER